MNTEHLPRALKEWVPHFEAAGAKYGIDPLYIAAICFRESGAGTFLRPVGAAGVGDFKARKGALHAGEDGLPDDGLAGWGRGLMQIDFDAFNAWCRDTLADGTPLWADAASNIDMGARILKGCLVDFRGDKHLAACAYNAGTHRVRGAVIKLGYGAQKEHEHIAADDVTTQHDYGKWVMEHYASFGGAA